MNEYWGYGYPAFLDSRLAHWFWRRFFCLRGWHLWDEVLSGSHYSSTHYFSCDACDLTVYVSGRSTAFVRKST